MKQLEQLGVQEMDAVEVKDVNGGVWPVVWVLLGMALAQDLDNLADAYNKGYEAGHN